MHYICVACGGVSDIPKECDTEECNLYGKKLAECDCIDGEHNKTIPPNEEAGDEPTNS